MVVFRGGETPLFKVERKQLEEVQVPAAAGCKTEAGRRRAEREFLFGLEDHLKPEPRQWVIVSSAPPFFSISVHQCPSVVDSILSVRRSQRFCRLPGGGSRRGGHRFAPEHGWPPHGG